MLNARLVTPSYESTDAVRILDVALWYVEEEKIKASLKKFRTEFEQSVLGHRPDSSVSSPD
jgi:hypothetical protein